MKIILMDGVIRDIAVIHELYLTDPIGLQYWLECNLAGDKLEPTMRQTFLASVLNNEMSKLSWIQMHINENWQAFFMSQVLHIPLEGH